MITSRHAPPVRPGHPGRAPEPARGRRHPARGLGFGAILAALVIWSAIGTGANPGLLVENAARQRTGDFLGGFTSPDLSGAHLAEVSSAMLSTLQISLVALVIGVLIAIPLTPFATSTLMASTRTPGLSLARRALAGVPYAVARNLLNLMRAIPDLIWALIFVTAVGLGPFAGALAIGVHSGGLLGKLWAEQIEAVEEGPLDAVRLLGVGRFGLIALVLWPLARRNVLSLTLYQWECNLRAATIVGFVGAGGIGQQLDVSIRLFQYPQTATLILALLVMVVAADALSALVRRAAR
ncbi:MAG: phosphonate ABC transporter, permease protein PhnE [Solirubrobacterales bacterium]|nr:phosphonate ABC transporter, permease protein PhnE [Solirubrobacterales bacterium]